MATVQKRQVTKLPVNSLAPPLWTWWWREGWLPLATGQIRQEGERAFYKAFHASNDANPCDMPYAYPPAILGRRSTAQKYCAENTYCHLIIARKGSHTRTRTYRKLWDTFACASAMPHPKPPFPFPPLLDIAQDRGYNPHCEHDVTYYHPILDVVICKECRKQWRKAY